MLHYFSKEALSNPFLVAGKPVGWEQLAGNRGWKILNDENPPDQALADALNQAAAESRGGIIRHTSESLETLKKKYPWTASPSNSKPEMLSIIRSASDPLPKGAAPAVSAPHPLTPGFPEAPPAPPATAENPNPVVAPPAPPKPRPATRRASSVSTAAQSQ